MELEQVKRWKEFARAMVYSAWPDITDARKQKLWDEVEAFINRYADEPVDGWDEDYCLCDCFVDWFGHYEETIWVEAPKNAWWGGYYKDSPRYFANQLRIILRASVNRAIDLDRISVIGFEVGDIKRMYGGIMPDWFLAQYPALTNDTPEHLSIGL